MWTCWSSKGKVILVVKALSGGSLGSFGSSPLVTPQLRASPAHLSGAWAAGVLWDHGVCTINLHCLVQSWPKFCGFGPFLIPRFLSASRCCMMESQQGGSNSHRLFWAPLRPSITVWFRAPKFRSSGSIRSKYRQVEKPPGMFQSCQQDV